MTQEEFRDEYARKEGYGNWSDMMDYVDHFVAKLHLNRVMILYAKYYMKNNPT